MRARLAEITLLLVAFAVLVAAGGASATSSAGTVGVATNGTLGVKILVDARGFTLYHFTSEKKGSVSCTGACRKVWPPLLLASGKPVAGTGVTASKLGTIKRPDGGVQVTYDGYSLYHYSADKKAGQVKGQGIAGKWFALTPAGAVTKAKPTTASTTSTKTSGSGGSTSGGSASGSGGSAAGGGGGAPTVDSLGCPPGQVISQGVETGSNNSDDDDDNEGGADDGDGCV